MYREESLFGSAKLSKILFHAFLLTFSATFDLDKDVTISNAASHNENQKKWDPVSIGVRADDYEIELYEHVSHYWYKIMNVASMSAYIRDINQLYHKSDLVGFSNRNLTELVLELANSMNKAIMRKLKAVENLVKVAEKSYVDYVVKPPDVNGSAAQITYFDAKDLKICPDDDKVASPNNTINSGNSSRRNIRITDSSENDDDDDDDEDIRERPCLLLKEDKHFMDLKVNLSHSTVHVPTIIYRKSKEILDSAAWSYHLNKAFLENYQNDPEITWQYFCGDTGLYRTWPGTSWTYPENMPDDKKVDLFDCRVRTWYVKATSSPRDVVILIDNSGSMTGIKRSIAVQTVETILDTLSDDDFVNILSFNNEVRYVDKCFDSGLVQATVENRKHLRDSIDNLPTRDIANFSKAFESAFQILNMARAKISEVEKVKCICQSHYTNILNKDDIEHCALDRPTEGEDKFFDSSGCNKMIMVVTDGSSENAEEIFRRYNWNPDYKSTCHSKETRVFTYLIGRELGDERAVRWMACANKGFYAHVSTLEDIQDNVQDYIPVMARPMAISGDHVTVWSSVFLDVEKNDPLKEYKWYPYKLKNKAEPMEVFKARTKKYHLMISVAQPAFVKLENQTNKGGLLGAVAVDIPVRLLYEFAPIYRLGVHGYSFLINHNGYVIYHPDLRPVLGEYRKRNYNSIDIDALEIPADLEKYIYPLPESPIQVLRREMIQGRAGVRSANVKKAFDDMRRIEIIDYSYYFSTLGDKNSNPFSLGIAVRKPYGEKEIIAKNINRTVIEVAMEFAAEKNVRFANWVYCNSTIENRVENLERPITHYLKEKISASTAFSCTTDSSRRIIDRAIVDLYIMSLFNKSRNVTVKEILFGGVEVTFIASSTGITSYWCNPTCSPSQLEVMSHFLSSNNDTIQSVYYERTVNFTFEEHMAKKKINPDHFVSENFLFSLFFVPTTFSDGTKDQLPYIVATTAVWLNESDVYQVPVGVVGVILSHERIFHLDFIAKLSKFCEERDTAFRCFVIDEHGYIMAHGMHYTGSGKNEHIGKFFGEVNGFIMNDMIQRELFNRIIAFDFQSVCVIEKNRIHKAKSSARGLSNLFAFRVTVIFKSIISMFFYCVLMQPLYWVKSLATPRSLTNVLPTHIDFQKPHLSIKEIHPASYQLEACIEKFNLYLSKVNNVKKTSYEAECINANHPRERPCKMRYTFHRLWNSNLYFLHYINGCEDCIQGQKFKIARNSVELTEKEKCVRLRSTPYRERPQKCYFVNDMEDSFVCSKAHKHMLTYTLYFILIYLCFTI